MKTVQVAKQKLGYVKESLTGIEKTLRLKPKFQKGDIFTWNKSEFERDFYEFETYEKPTQGNWDIYNQIFEKWQDKFSNLSEQDLQEYIEDVKPYIPTKYLNQMTTDLIYICVGGNHGGHIAALLLPGRKFEIRKRRLVWSKDICDDHITEGHYEYDIAIVGDSKTLKTFKEDTISKMISE